MGITLQIELNEDIAKKAAAAGLLDPGRVSQMLADELRRCQERQELREQVERARNKPGNTMTLEEIQIEVSAVRADRQQRESRS